VNGKPAADYALAIGVRNSYDRSLSVGLTLGNRVFCCDNGDRRQLELPPGDN
jgi:hypothetical protein